MASVHIEEARMTKDLSRDIPYYNDYVSTSFGKYLCEEGQPLFDVDGLVGVGQSGGLETKESLNFLCELYNELKVELNTVLEQRRIDREFIDQRTMACSDDNYQNERGLLDNDYSTVIGHEDGNGRVVIGPLREDYAKTNGVTPIADIPEWLQGIHVTLFGPPGSEKMSINAMNAYHRQLKGEPEIIRELLRTQTSLPKWGADDEDSKTPLREDLVIAGKNLSECFNNTLEFTDPKTKKEYKLAQENQSLPIKRFPGLALPCPFLFLNESPIPLHLYDFALHLFDNWHNPKSLVFYVPKLENEEEARYIHSMISLSEKKVKEAHPEYVLGSVRVLVVLENPRAVFRLNEMMNELHPYFAGASLGWHDYLGSTARLFKEDSNYRIPVKADPDIVIKHIKGSHELLRDVVGPAGGIKIGGMYGILPTGNDIESDSFQVCIRGFIKDIVTQMKRGLSGFWVAHPDFVRIGLALVEAWKFYSEGDKSKLDEVIKTLVNEKYHEELHDFIKGNDVEGLKLDDPLYMRSLLAADIAESGYIPNNHPDEVRYNVFQSLQYLTDWLSGNGCVALPAQIDNVPVRMMDDLATAERSRWEVWHELYHGRFELEEFLKIAHEEFHFIRKDLSNEKKIVQVKWNDRTDKWYPIALKLMIKLMTDSKPCEFATELLLPFTIDSIRNSDDPWKKLSELEPSKYYLGEQIERFNYYFEMCGCERFAKTLGNQLALNKLEAEWLVLSFSKEEIIEAASFHGNIGESNKTLDKMASGEQKGVEESEKAELRKQGEKYLEKFGFKFLVSAKGKSGPEMLKIMQDRFENTEEEELSNARKALWEITNKRFTEFPRCSLLENFNNIQKKYDITGASISLTDDGGGIQDISLGEQSKGGLKVDAFTRFEMASLSKSVGTAFAIEFFSEKGIPLETSVNQLLESTSSSFRLKGEWAQAVTLRHLMSHTALNMHYVNGVPLNIEMPNTLELISGNSEFDYPALEVLNEPGKNFSYSGGGFLLLEHLIEAIENKSIQALSRDFLDNLGMSKFSFVHGNEENTEYAHGYNDEGNEIESGRKMFPAFAAGATSTSNNMLFFLQNLTKAYHRLEGSGSLSHNTAREMLCGKNFGSRKFMGVDTGLGIFTAECGENKICIHQGANDGFRGLFMFCYEGPDIGKGLTVFANSDNKGMLFISEVTQLILKSWSWNGLDSSKLISDFDYKSIKQEEIVNLGYKSLIFNAFTPMLPELFPTSEKLLLNEKSNILKDAKVLSVSNERFARAENLISSFEPVFDAFLFGRQGKIMDSWESVRHNYLPYDNAVFELKKSSKINYVSVSTKYHLGNQAESIEILGQDSNGEWSEVLAKTNLNGHSEYRAKIDSKESYTKIEVRNYPDGGISRLGLYENVSNESDFNGEHILFKDEIAHSEKPLFMPFSFSESEARENYKNNKGNEINIANAKYGAKIISSSNEHYGPASQILSPFEPISMFDGFESARSRVEGHIEEIEVQLASDDLIQRIELDFQFFVNNNPKHIEVLGFENDKWITIIPKNYVKPFAGNLKEFVLEEKRSFKKLKLIIHPDGGLNRLRVFASKR